MQTTTETPSVPMAARLEYQDRERIARGLVEKAGIAGAIAYCEQAGLDDVLDVLLGLCTAGAFTIH
jgi:hypothetical protein